MNLYIENEQEKIAFTEEHEALIEKVLNSVLENEGFLEECEISVVITDDENICALNKEYRNKNVPTDVLSFPMLEFDEDLNIISGEDGYEGPVLLGDIVLSLERALAQSEEYNHSLEREIGFLCAHSTLHLLGYDHEDSEESRLVMRKKEEAALLKIGLTR
jgi:probable rRNA maturation factor